MNTETLQLHRRHARALALAVAVWSAGAGILAGIAMAAALGGLA
jgi:hypothetical protein